MANAEKALNQIGISTRTVKDGIVELKAPSEVLGELAAQFEAGKISAEELSKIMNAVGSKQQADVLAAIVQNWDLYTKAMEDFENAHGSAAEEAMKDLESWQGKINVLTNTWTMFVAKSLDTKWIKNLLDGGTLILNLLDNIGTTLKLLAGWFLVFKSGSIIRTFQELNKALSTTDSKFKGLIGLVLNYSAASKKAKADNISLAASYKALGVSANFAQLAIGSVVAAFTLYTVVSNAKKMKNEELMRQSLASAQALRSETDALEDLTEQYKDLQAMEQTAEVREELNSLQQTFIDKFGKEVEGIDLVTGSYEQQLEILEELRKERLKEERRALELPARDANNVLSGNDSKFFVNKNIIDNTDFFDELDRSRFNVEAGRASQYDIFAGMNLHEEAEAISNILDKIEEKNELTKADIKLKDDLLKRQTDINSKIEENIEIAKRRAEIHLEENEIEILDRLKIAHEEYSAALNSNDSSKIEEKRDAWHEVLLEIENLIELLDDEAIYSPALQEAIDDLIHGFDLANDSIVSTFEHLKGDIENMFSDMDIEIEFDVSSLDGLDAQKLRNISAYLKEADDSGKDLIATFIQTDETIKNMSVDELSASLSELTGIVLEVEQNTFSLVLAQEELREASEQLNEEIDSLESAWSAMTTAQEEYNETGEFTAKTVQNLLALGDEYLQYLTFSEGKLHLNTDAIKEKEEALRDEAIALAHASLAEEVRAIITMHSTQATEDSKNATKSHGDMMIEYGKKLVDVQGDIAATTALIHEMNAALMGEELSPAQIASMMSDIDAAYSNFETRLKILQHTTTPSRTNGSNRTPSSSSSGKSSPSSSSASKAQKDPVVIELDNLLLLQKRYSDLENELSVILRLKEDISKSTEEQIALSGREVEIYKEQQNLLHQQNEQRRTDMQVAIHELSKYGIEVEFNPSLNEVEFKQTVDEINNAINAIDLGDPDKTSELRKNLEGYTNEIIRLNQANQQGSSAWHSIQASIYNAQLEAINLNYSEFINETTKALGDLDFQLRLLGDGDFDKKVELTNKQLELQKQVVEQNNQQLVILQNAYIDGQINASQFAEETEKVTKAMQDSTLQAKQYAESLRNLELASLNQQKNALNEIINLTKNLIRQEENDRIKALEETTKEYQRQKQILSEMENALNDLMKAERELANQKKNDLNEQLRLERERASEALKAIDDEVRAYRDKINLQKSLLREERDQRNYEQGLEDRRHEVTTLENRLAELKLRDDPADRAEILRIEAELKKKQRDLDNFVHDQEIKDRESALDSEFDRYEKDKQKEKDLINDNLKVYEQAHQDRLDMIDKELQAYEKSIESQINGIKQQKDEYDKMSDNVREQIADIQERISQNGTLTLEAMARIDAEGDELYEKLVEWNKIYGTGIQQDITNSWVNANDVMKNNVNTLETMVSLMEDILVLSREISYAQSNMNNTYGIRDYFGNDRVDWNPATGQFSVDGTWFDSNDYTNIDGHLYATEKELEELKESLRNLPKHDKGAYVRTDHTSVVHSGERILRKIETEDLHNILPQMLNSQYEIKKAQDRLLDSLENRDIKSKIQNITNSPNIELVFHNTVKVDGVATDTIVKDFDKKLTQNNKKITNDMMSEIKKVGGMPKNKHF